MAKSKIGLAEQQAKGAAMQAIIENPLMGEALAALEQRYISDFRTSDRDDDNARKDAYLSLQLLADFSSHLIQVAASGRAAGRELKRLSDEEQRKAEQAARDKGAR